MADEQQRQEFAAVVARYGEMLSRVALVYAGDPDAAADLRQEILLAVWRALPQFRGDAAERTFVFRIAHNRGISWRAAQRTHARLDDVVEPVAPGPPPDAQLAADQLRRRLFACVASLPASTREAVMLQLEGLTHGEIADVLGISINNVAVRLHRGRTLLRAAMLPEAEHERTQ